eukprot:scaffold5013_cov273-Pinguiococcus_pyrenoidosus.AAC.4
MVANVARPVRQDARPEEQSDLDTPEQVDEDSPALAPQLLDLHSRPIGGFRLVLHVQRIDGSRHG